MQPTLYALGSDSPQAHPEAYVAPGAFVIGDVHLHAGASVWFNSVIRADLATITVGASSNVQDGSILHVDEGFPLSIGESVTVGHKAMLHGCTIDELSLIGINAVVLNGAHIAKHCIVGAGALIPEGKSFPERSLIIGAPGRVVREVTDEEIELLQHSARHYAETASHYRDSMRSAQ